MNELQTPGAVDKLEESVRTDLALVHSHLVEGARLLEGLEDCLKVLPSSQSRIRGWRQQIDVMLGHIAEEQADVTRKLLGGNEPPTISESIDHAHLEVVRAAKDEEAA